MSDRNGNHEPLGAAAATRTAAPEEPPAAERWERVPTLTLLHCPDAERVGERAHITRAGVSVNRLAAPFPGGPLPDRELSRAHAEVLLARGGRIAVRDLGSKNGTWADGVRVAKGAERPVAPGSFVRVGRCLFLVSETDARREGRRLVGRPAIPLASFVGASDAARKARAAALRYAADDSPVLVLGETGVGKDVLARVVGERGRPKGPFVPFNAAATPTSLMASALFGHERGAFSGATEARQGLVRAVDGGTLFLDEVGELPAEAQVYLLRLLDHRAVMPVGGTRELPVDLRVVAATNRDLLAEIATGRFRADLYGRLAGRTIVVPPLRERREDVAVLIRHFARKRRFTMDAMQVLLEHPWPFNVRELRDAVTEATAASAKDPLGLPEEVTERLAASRAHFEAAETSTPTPESDAGDLDDDTVREALSNARGNVSQAARALGRDRTTLYRYLRRHGLRPDDFR